MKMDSFVVYWGIHDLYEKGEVFYNKKEANQFFNDKVKEGFSSASEHPYVVMLSFKDSRILECKSYLLSNDGINKFVDNHIKKAAKFSDIVAWERFKDAINFGDNGNTIEIVHLHSEYHN